jgi:hypothetical protein
MSKLIVTKELVDYLLAELVPYVEQATGWQLDINRLNIQVVPRELAYEAIVLHQNVLRYGDQTEKKEQLTYAVHPLIEKMIESNILGAFEPSTCELIIVKENVDDSNLDGLKVVILHELVHYGQYLYHSTIFDNLENLRYQVTTAVENREAGKAMDLLGKTQQLMTLLESHAHFIEEQIKNRVYPRAKVESHFNWATILMSIISPSKQAQYLDGLPVISQAAKSSRIDDLFRQAY